MTHETLDLVVVQENPTVGDIEGNTKQLLKYLMANKSADLIVFPECYLTGYPLGDLVLRPGFQASIAEAVAKIREGVIWANGPAVLFGAPMGGATLPYNAAYLIEPSGSVRTVRKHELPNNDVFDERRTFTMSDERPAPLPFRGFNLGVQLCEDMWHGDVSRGLADELADILIVLNGSPYQEGKQALRRKIARTRINDTGLPLIYANLVGGQDELVFDGASFIMNVAGGCFEAPAFQECTMGLQLAREDDLVEIHVTGEQSMASYPQDPIESDYNAAVLALRDYVGKIGAPHVVIGISGGLDSALVAAMAVDALGSDRVVGVMMPSEYTGDESLGLADDLMDRLGIHKAVLPIGEMFDATVAGTLPIYGEIGKSIGREVDPGITSENFQARLRGMALMGLTNAIGGIVLSTGNKSEMSVGYATLYGDMSGGYNPLKSVYKSEAFRMAEWRNAQDKLLTLSNGAISNPIPSGIITRPPTAELAEDQTDQASLGDYDLLDSVLKSVIEDKADARTAAAVLVAKFDEDDIFKRTGGYQAITYAEKIARLVRNAQYKRDQSCPGVKLNLTDFGLGWRYPIAGKYAL